MSVAGIWADRDDKEVSRYKIEYQFFTLILVSFLVSSCHVVKFLQATTSEDGISYETQNNHSINNSYP